MGHPTFVHKITPPMDRSYLPHPWTYQTCHPKSHPYLISLFCRNALERQTYRQTNKWLDGTFDEMTIGCFRSIESDDVAKKWHNWLYPNLLHYSFKPLSTQNSIYWRHSSWWQSPGSLLKSLTLSCSIKWLSEEMSHLLHGIFDVSTQESCTSRTTVRVMTWQTDHLNKISTVASICFYMSSTDSTYCSDRRLNAARSWMSVKYEFHVSSMLICMTHDWSLILEQYPPSVELCHESICSEPRPTWLPRKTVATEHQHVAQLGHHNF